MERSFDDSVTRAGTGEVVVEPSRTVRKGEEELKDIDRLITKGRHVLDLCIEQDKLLCVQGFVDSQIERGAAYIDVVVQMKAYIEKEMEEAQGRDRQKTLRELHEYIEGALEPAEVVAAVTDG